MVGSLARSMVAAGANTFREARYPYFWVAGVCLVFRCLDVLPPDEPCINGPGARSGHCQTGTENGQHQGNQWIVDVRQNNP
jgi:hypothetical protein